MRLLRVSGQCFGPFVEPFALTLDRQGLVFVVGDNRVDAGFDSNGAGKSTLLDAVMWGLFGETSPRKESTSSDSGLKSDEVVNDTTGKDCVVCVDFQAADDRAFRVRRWRKAKPPWVNVRGNGVDLVELHPAPEMGGDLVELPVADLDKANVQREIGARLGFTRALFGETVLRGQEDLSTFALSTPAGRFDLLTSIEGLQELDRWDALFRARSRQLGTDLATLAGLIQGQQAAVDVLKQPQANDDEAAGKWEADRNARITSLHGQRQHAVSSIEAIDRRASARPVILARRAEISAQLAQLKAPIAEAPELAQWRARVSDLVGQQSVHQHEEERLRQQLARFARLGVGACATCGQEITAGHLEQHKAQVQKELDELAPKKAATAAALAEARAVVAKADADISVLRAQRSETMGALSREDGTLAASQRAIDDEARTRAHQMAEIQRIDGDIVAEQNKPNPVRAAAAARQAALLEQEKKLDELKQDRALKSSEAGLHDWWVRHLPVMKAWIFDGVVGEITREANRWLGVLTGGVWWVEVAATSMTKGGEVRDKVSLRVFRWGSDGSIQEREFRQLSGGQKRRVSLALEWAIAARLVQRSHTWCSFLALDEVDRGLDASGRAGLLNALDILRREKETVVVVTHDADTRAKPDVVWRVTRTSSGSKVEVVRGGEGEAQARGVAQAGGVLDAGGGDAEADVGGRPAGPGPRKAGKRPRRAGAGVAGKA